MSRPDDEAQMKRFLDTLREHGGSAGNMALMGTLGWSENEYWRLREKLIESGNVLRGRGRGGSVTLVEEVLQDEKPTPSVGVRNEVEPRVMTEVGLYEPCLKILREKWTQERMLRDFHVEITAAQGGKKTGGIWTRPDITAISMRTFTHWPGRVFDVWTFEIKPRWQFNVTGVFEAAAHARSATHSYAMFETPDDLDESDVGVSRLISEAQRLGVGLVLFKKAEDFDTWDFKVEPLRREPDPALLEEFVVTQLSDDARNNLLRWGK